MDGGDSKIESMGCFFTCYNNVAPDPAEGIRIHISWVMLATKHRGCYKIGYLFGPELGDAIQTSKNLSR